jgi:DNA polymerase-3 subunit delta'
MAARKAAFRFWSNKCRQKKLKAQPKRRPIENMAFRDFAQQQSVSVLQRCLDKGRLAHAYLFTGADLTQLEDVARTLAKALNCEQPPKLSASGLPLDSCDQCPTCRRIDDHNHPDILSVRPESKSRIITIEQMRDLMHTIFLKPSAATWKVAVIVCADRLNVQAANAFLKTLEEPPHNSIIILLSTEPQRVLETLLSRCARLNFADGTPQPRDPTFLQWLARFAEVVAVEQKSLLGRYQLLSAVLNRLNEIKAGITESLTKRSPLERYTEIDPKTRDRFEDELAAAIEAEYRRQRGDLLAGIHWWLRDVWLQTLALDGEQLSYPELAKQARAIANRVDPAAAMANLSTMEQIQRMLASNVQEALTLEVGLLRLKV